MGPWESLLSHFLGHFNAFCVSLELGGRRLHKGLLWGKLKARFLAARRLEVQPRRPDSLPHARGFRIGKRQYIKYSQVLREKRLI